MYAMTLTALKVRINGLGENATDQSFSVSRLAA